MTAPHRMLGRAIALLVCSSAWPVAGAAFANVAIGDALDNVELPTLETGHARFLSTDALANVFIFFRPRQEHSLETLKQMAACQKEFAGKPVHWVAIVSSSWPAEDVRKTVVDAGIEMPVLVDRGDALYGKLGVRLHPTIGVTNDKLQLVGYEPFHKINYCDRIRAKIRFALHEADAAEVARSENPERATDANDIPGAVAKRHVRMGELYLRAQQWEKAAAEAQRALEKDGRIAAAHVLLGDALAGVGKCGEAATAYDQAIALEPGLRERVQLKRRGCAAVK